MPTQANLQIMELAAKKNTDSLQFKFTVFNNNDDTARMVRVIVILPVNVRVQDVQVEEKKAGSKGYQKVSGECKISDKCEVYWNSSVSINRPQGSSREFYDATVCIDLAYLDVNEKANVFITTGLPENVGHTPTFGAFVYGALPDHDPASNYKTAIAL